MFTYIPIINLLYSYVLFFAIAIKTSSKHALLCYACLWKKLSHGKTMMLISSLSQPAPETLIKRRYKEQRKIYTTLCNRMSYFRSSGSHPVRPVDVGIVNSFFRILSSFLELHDCSWIAPIGSKLWLKQICFHQLQISWCRRIHMPW